MTTGIYLTVQKIWSLLIGLASTAIGILKFVSVVEIPVSDALMHLITGVIFVSGIIINNAEYIRKINLWLGIFYVVFGIIGSNVPHLFVGLISIAISMIKKTAKSHAFDEKINSHPVK